MQEEEIWKDIKGYEGFYQVSNMGRVRSLDRIDCRGEFIKGKILSPGSDKRGYQRVSLCKNRVIKIKLVHRLVGEHFIENPNNYPCINHKDCNPKNNKELNLEWVTHSMNMLHKPTHIKLLNRTDQSKRIYQFTKNGEFVREWPSAHEIKRELGYNNKHISRCCLGKRKTAYGFIWKYAA